MKVGNARLPLLVNSRGCGHDDVVWLPLVGAIEGIVLLGWLCEGWLGCGQSLGCVLLCFECVGAQFGSEHSARVRGDVVGVHEAGEPQEGEEQHGEDALDERLAH